MRIDLKIIAILIFLWGILNLTNGFSGRTDLLNVFKGLIAVIIGLYLFLGADDLVLLYKKGNGDE